MAEAIGERPSTKNKIIDLRSFSILFYDIFLLEINKQQIKAFKSEFSEEMGTKAWNTFEDYKHYRKHYEYLLNQKKEHEENINATIKKMKKAS